MDNEHKRRSEAMDKKRWYAADALRSDLTNRHHHIRAASEEEAERRMRKRYPGAVAVLVYPEESWRQRSVVVAPDGPVR
jgi:hypothetical protein